MKKIVTTLIALLLILSVSAVYFRISYHNPGILRVPNNGVIVLYCHPEDSVCFTDLELPEGNYIYESGNKTNTIIVDSIQGVFILGEAKDNLIEIH